jgi:hypothetical protein
MVLSIWASGLVDIRACIAPATEQLADTGVEERRLRRYGVGKLELCQRAAKGVAPVSPLKR